MLPHWLPFALVALGAVVVARAAVGARLLAAALSEVSTRRAKREASELALVRGRLVRLDGQPDRVVGEGACALTDFTLRKGSTVLVAERKEGPLTLSDKRGLIELELDKGGVLLPEGFVVEGGLDDPPPGLVRTLYQRFGYDAPRVSEGKGFRYRELRLLPGDEVKALGTLRTRNQRRVLGRGRFPLVVGGPKASLTRPLYRRLAVEALVGVGLAALGGVLVSSSERLAWLSTFIEELR